MPQAPTKKDAHKSTTVSNEWSRRGPEACDAFFLRRSNEADAIHFVERLMNGKNRSISKRSQTIRTWFFSRRALRGLSGCENFFRVIMTAPWVFSPGQPTRCIQHCAYRIHAMFAATQTVPDKTEYRRSPAGGIACGRRRNHSRRMVPVLLSRTDFGDITFASRYLF